MRAGFRGRWNDPEAGLQQPALSREVLDRVARVLDYHRTSKLSFEGVRRHPHTLDWANRPSPFRVFSGQRRVQLPTTVLDIPGPSLRILFDGIEALPESQQSPPQDLKTLGSWLFYANGITSEKKFGQVKYWLRSVPSAGSLFPCEIYVAALGIAGLEPGLYHYCPRGFFLEYLRDGHTAISLIKRGRPELEFLKDVPAVLLISTVFCRGSWGFRQRAYRYALHDAGAMIENLVSTANGLGMQTHVRLRLNDRNMHELLGVAADAPFGEAEAVQGMVAWTDQAAQPLPHKPTNGRTGPEALAPIPREPLAAQCTPYGSILATHTDCVAPGVAIRDVRPPVTQLTPLPEKFPTAYLHPPEPPDGGKPMRHVLRNRHNSAEFAQLGLPRTAFWTINRVAFRSGSYCPVYPQGPHIGLIRPFWIIHDVAGMAQGITYYDLMSDQWAPLRPGSFRKEAAYLSTENPAWGLGAAACFICADLKQILHSAGPDAYRLAHIEAGLAAQRMQLAADAAGLASYALGAFYDDEVRTFLGLDHTTWEPLHNIVVGMPVERPAAAAQPANGAAYRDWR